MPGPSGVDVPLPGQLGTAEDRIALGDQGLQQLGSDAAGRELLVAENAGRLLKDEVVVARVIGLAVEAESPWLALEADLGGVGGLDDRPALPMSKVWVASCGPLANSSSALRRALDALQGQACHQIRRQILDDAEGDALRRVVQVGWRSRPDRPAAAGNSPGTSTAVPVTLTLSMRPASCVRSVSVCCISLKK